MAKEESPRAGKWEKGKAPKEVYEGKKSNVVKESDERGSAAKKMNTGGRTKRKEGGKVEGSKADVRADRAKRKSGGLCSSDWAAAQGEGTRRPKSTEEP